MGRRGQGQVAKYMTTSEAEPWARQFPSGGCGLSGLGMMGPWAGLVNTTALHLLDSGGRKKGYITKDLGRHKIKYYFYFW